MKIDCTRLNSIYDQYSNEENRLTHALLHTIASSNNIFSDFLTKFLAIKSLHKSGIFEISTQKVPFNHGDDKKEKVQSIPDGWIINEKTNFGIAIEVKDKKNNIRIGQLKSHINRIKTYDDPYLVVITPDINMPIKLNDLDQLDYPNLRILWKSWDEIYWWLINLVKERIDKKDVFLAKSMLEYLERRREVLGFQGIFFNKGFNVDEAKEILKSEMDELQPYVKSLYKGLVKRRGAITTMSVKSVWDCFGHEDGFTNDIHITISINEESHNIAMVVPNSSGKAWRRLKNIFSNDNLQNKLISILARLRSKVPYLYAEFNQRHYVTRQKAIQDGKLFFSLDAVGEPFQQKETKTKLSPIWFQALQEAIINKRKLNGQVAFISIFFLNETKDIDNPKFINTVKTTLSNIKPLYEYLKLDN